MCVECKTAAREEVAVLNGVANKRVEIHEVEGNATRRLAGTRRCFAIDDSLVLDAARCFKSALGDDDGTSEAFRWYCNSGNPRFHENPYLLTRFTAEADA